MSDDYTPDLLARIKRRQKQEADIWAGAVDATVARQGNEQDRGLAVAEHSAFAQGVQDQLGPVVGSAVLGAAVPGYQAAKLVAQNPLIPGSATVRALGDAAGVPLAGPKVTPPGLDQLAAGLAPVGQTLLDAGRAVVGAIGEAAGMNRGGGPLESALDLLPIKPEHRPPTAGVRAVDAPFKMANAAAQDVVFRPLGDLLRAAGVPDEFVDSLKEAFGIAAEMAIPINAAGLPAKAGTSGIDAMASGARALEKGAKKVAPILKDESGAALKGTNK